VLIQPRLAFETIKNDTLLINMFLDIENRASNKKYSIQIRSWGLFDTTSYDSPYLYRIGHALASYRRLSPYRRAVSFFYPENVGRQDL
jgi:hypothetical protein